MCLTIDDLHDQLSAAASVKTRADTPLHTQGLAHAQAAASTQLTALTEAHQAALHALRLEHTQRTQQLNQRHEVYPHANKSKFTLILDMKRIIFYPPFARSRVPPCLYIPEAS